MATMTRVFVYESLSGGADTGGEAAGELLAMGQAMRDAVVADLLALQTYHVSVATCKLAAAPAPLARPVTPHDGESAAHFVRRQAGAHDLAWVIAPETDGLLAALHPCVEPRRWLGCDLPAIEVATSKHATLAALAAAGIATPLAFKDSPEVDRWVVKPDDGAGALATRVHRGRAAAWADWRVRAAAGEHAVMEPWIEGCALSLSLMCGPRQAKLLCVNQQQLHVDAQGWLSFRGVQANAVPPADARYGALAALAAQVHGAIPGLRGFVGIDLVWHARIGPVVIEVNPRVTCAYVGLSSTLGRNLAADAIACHDRARAAAAASCHA